MDLVAEDYRHHLSSLEYERALDRVPDLFPAPNDERDAYGGHYEDDYRESA